MTGSMGVEEDLEVIAEQERLLQWPAFDADAAWQLGGALRAELVARGAGGTVEIEMAAQVLFSCVTAGAPPGQADWVRRKRNVVRRFARSSYAIGLALERDGETLPGRQGLELRDYAPHGGGFPLIVRGVGCIGSVVVSGLPQREDHGLVVAVMARVLGLDVPALT